LRNGSWHREHLDGGDDDDADEDGDVGILVMSLGLDCLGLGLGCSVRSLEAEVGQSPNRLTPRTSPLETERHATPPPLQTTRSGQQDSYNDKTASAIISNAKRNDHRL
jgi:hypothetical protein